MAFFIAECTRCPKLPVPDLLCTATILYCWLLLHAQKVDGGLVWEKSCRLSDDMTLEKCSSSCIMYTFRAGAPRHFRRAPRAD
eukprot:5162163-Pleurochrysis_carterae.AAC.1